MVLLKLRITATRGVRRRAGRLPLEIKTIG
jgi:hypothetical protein